MGVTIVFSPIHKRSSASVANNPSRTDPIRDHEVGAERNEDGGQVVGTVIEERFLGERRRKFLEKWI